MSNIEKAMNWFDYLTLDVQIQFATKYFGKNKNTIDALEVEKIWIGENKPEVSILSDEQCIMIINALNEFSKSEDIELGLPQGETNTKTMINIIKNVII